MTPAAQLIQNIKDDVLQATDEWVEVHDKGFHWWPHLIKQSIYTDAQRTEPDGTLMERVVVTTDVCTLIAGVSITHPEVTNLTQQSTMSGLIADGQKLRLHAHAWIDRSNIPLYQMILGTVAGIQIGEACIIAIMANKAGIGEPDFSGHPINGLRHEPDEMTSVFKDIVVPMGETNPPWPKSMLDDFQKTYMDHPPCLLANSSPSSMTAEFPFGKESSLLRVTMTESHPHAGNGMLVINAFKVKNLHDPLLNDPISMNAWEIEHGDGPFLGSWSAQKNDSMSFLTFVPNALQHQVAACNIILNSVIRARLMSVKWLDDDWSKTWDAKGKCRAKTAIERSLRL